MKTQKESRKVTALRYYLKNKEMIAAKAKAFNIANKEKRALQQISTGKVELPIVANYSDGYLELIGGNTRLTALMKATGKGKVWQFDVPDNLEEKESLGLSSKSEIYVDMDGVLAAQSTLPIINGEIDFVNGEVHKWLKPVKQVMDILRFAESKGHEGR